MGNIVSQGKWFAKTVSKNKIEDYLIEEHLYF
jgi:hypothetical protein